MQFLKEFVISPKRVELPPFLNTWLSWADVPEAQRRRFQDDLAGASAAMLGEFEKQAEE